MNFGSSNERTGENSPARVESLTIFRPSLGATEETQRDQIVFHYVASKRHYPTGKDDSSASGTEKEVQNQALRQVGLARGMNAFAKTFSCNGYVDSVESDKYRAIQVEVESGWWILARIRAASHSRIADHDKQGKHMALEYSTRDISPRATLENHLQRAYRIFMLHHGRSLTDLFGRMQRGKFNALLSSFWLPFTRTWDVNLHANPAADMFSGIRIASSGELGIGVGEEEWGSGERAAIEGIISDTPGLSDCVLFRFTRPNNTNDHATGPSQKLQSSQGFPRWLGAGQEPQSADGVIFSGVGVLSRKSVRDLADWAHWIFKDGTGAYGVRDSLRAVRQRKSRSSGGINDSKESSKQRDDPMGERSGINATSIVTIPPPIILSTQSRAPDLGSSAQTMSQGTNTAPVSSNSDGSQENRGWRKYLTFGYGTSWTTSQGYRHAGEAESTDQVLTPNVSLPREAARDRDIATLKDGSFLIGLEGELSSAQADDKSMRDASGNRIVARSIYVRTHEGGDGGTDNARGGGADYNEDAVEQQNDLSQYRRMRVVMYGRQPFLFMFVFEPQSGHLEMNSFYHELHRSLDPLHQALLLSTSETRSLQRERAQGALQGVSLMLGDVESSLQSMFSLTYDAQSLNVRCTIPDILQQTQYKDMTGWSRLEALNIQTQVITTVAETGRGGDDRERISKTSRGWWVTWVRVSPRVQERANQAIIVRRAGVEQTNAESSKGARSLAGLGRLVSSAASSANVGHDSARFSDEAMGFDTRKYVSALFSLNR